MPAQRLCGDCQLCCKLLPTPEIGSPANTRCRHQKHGVGCAIYASRPLSCQLWSCGWLKADENDTLDLPRPDRAHYIIDPTTDYITLRPHDGSAESHLEVIQIWVDPQHRDAHRAPSLRRWLDRQHKPAVIRFDEREGFVLFPPSVSEDEQWHEEHATMREHSHTLEQKAAALGGSLTIEVTPGDDTYRAQLRIGDRMITVAAQQAEREQALAALADARKMIAERKP